MDVQISPLSEPAPSAKTAEPAAKAHTVKIYTTPVCPYCEMAKDFMKKNSIAFEEVDVTKDDRAFQDMVQKSGQLGVPVIEVDGTVAVGFNRKMISGLLDIPAA